MVDRYSRLIRYDEFVQRVRRHRPSELLPAIAETAVRFFDRETWMEDRLRTPWSLAGAAKASIVWGNEHRSNPVTERDVAAICAAFSAVEDPLTRGQDSLSDSVLAFMVRLASEQFLVQSSYFAEISRTAALFSDLSRTDLQVIGKDFLHELLGCTLTEYLDAGFVIAVGARQSAGYFDPAWPSLSNPQRGVDQIVPVDLIGRVFDTHFVADAAWIREEAERWTQDDPLLRRHEYNPLVARPFVVMPDGRRLAPQPHLAFQKLTPAPLYYLGVERAGNRFAEDVGALFQDYVGQHLEVIPDAEVLPEIVFGKVEDRSVDWFVIWEDLVLLVEVKSTRLTQFGRMGSDRLAEEAERCLGKALAQVSRTHALMGEGHPAFAHVPRPRRIVGIVVTLEPYWQANTDFMRSLLPASTIPTLVISSRELEGMVSLSPQEGLSAIVQDLVDDPEHRTWNVGIALDQRGFTDTPRNPILDEAWGRSTWAEGRSDNG